MRPVPFIIVADLRTGSTLVSTTLDHHPEARCLGELFHPQNLPDNCLPGINRFDLTGRELAAHAFARNGAKAAGFKSMIFLPTPDQPQWSDAWQALDETPDLHVIVLKRANALAQYISFLIARQTGKYHPSPGDPVLKPQTRPQVTVDPRAFHEWKNERRRLFRLRMEPLREKPTLHLEYADLIDCWRQNILRVLNFLHLTPMALKPAKSRQERRPLPETVVNYNELKILGLVD